MRASVHFADVGVASALRLMARRPRPAKVAGMRFAQLGFAARLGPKVLPRPDPRRVGMVALWDDDHAIDRFLADHPVAEAMAGGFRARLEPLRAHGAWPGLDADIPARRAVDADGPFIVVTLGRMRLTQAYRFFSTSARAEGGLAHADGLIWATGFGAPPFVATCSLWPDARSLSAYAYGAKQAVHAAAIAEGQREPFHKQEAFVRFRPYDVQGSLAGPNPLPTGALVPA